jgi:hypothetical protein
MKLHSYFELLITAGFIVLFSPKSYLSQTHNKDIISIKDQYIQWLGHIHRVCCGYDVIVGEKTIKDSGLQFII